MKWLKTKSVRDRIFYTIFILALFQLGSFMTLPGVIVHQTNSAVVDLINLTAGGTLSKFGFLALGVSPYITASIIIHLGSKGLVPYYVRLMEQGQSGRAKMAQHTRYLTVFFGMLSSLAITFSPHMSGVIGVTITANTSEKILLSIIMTAGALFSTYLGDRINERGIGNGQSMLIASGVISTLPGQVLIITDSYSLYKTLADQYWWSVALIATSTLLVILTAIWANNKEYHFPIHNKQNKEQIKAHYFPIKLLASSVMPVIFASAIISMVSVAAISISVDSSWFDMTQPKGIIVYCVLIYFFSYLYNLIQVDGEEISKNFKESGTYIIGVEQSRTAKFLSQKVISITHKGAPILLILAGLSLIADYMSPIKFGASLTGISVLILVGVVQELIHQIKGLTNKNNYEELI